MRAVPFVPQMEVAECGAACLAMVLGYFGRHVPLAELRRACGVSANGVSAASLSRVAEQHGLDVSALRADPEALARLRPERHGWLAPVALVLVGAVVARIALQALRDRALALLELALDLGLETSFVRHLCRLPAAFFEHRSTGDLIQRVQANTVLRALAGDGLRALLDGVLVLGYAALLLAYDIN